MRERGHLELNTISLLFSFYKAFPFLTQMVHRRLLVSQSEQLMFGVLTSNFNQKFILLKTSGSCVKSTKAHSDRRLCCFSVAQLQGRLINTSCLLGILTLEEFDFSLNAFQLLFHPHSTAYETIHRRHPAQYIRCKSLA